MESLAARRRLRPRPRRGYWSPIVWASMATGKVPDKHGIVDFLLPVPGTSFAWVGSDDGPPEATLHVPELVGPPPHELHLRLRSYAPNGTQDVTITMNGNALGAVEVSEREFLRLRAPDPPGCYAACSEHDRARVRATIASVGSRSVERPAHARGCARLATRHRFQRRPGGGIRSHLRSVRARARVSPAGSQSRRGRKRAHARATGVESLGPELGHPVGVVGYWNTWPAYEVNGFLISSHLGVRGKRQGIDDQLTWPPELVDDIEALSAR